MGRGYSGNHPRFSKRGDERYDAKEAYNKDLTASARLHYLENDRHDHESPNHMSVNQRLDDSFGMGQNTDKTPSPMKAHTKSHKLREKAIKISERSGAERGDEYDYENPRVMKLVDKAKKFDERSMKKAFAGAAEAAAEAGGSMTKNVKSKPRVKVNDERSGEIRNKMIDEMIDERPDSPMNNLKGPVKDRVIEKIDNPQPPMPEKIERGKGFIPMPKTREEFLKIHKPQEPLMPGHGLENRGKGFIPMDKNRKVVLPSYDVEFTRLPNPGLQSPVNACAKSEGGSGCVKKMGGAWRVISNKTDKPWPAKYASKAKADAALRGYHAG